MYHVKQLEYYYIQKLYFYYIRNAICRIVQNNLFDTATVVMYISRLLS